MIELNHTQFNPNQDDGYERQSDRDQPRARAHSTGAGADASAQAAREASEIRQRRRHELSTPMATYSDTQLVGGKLQTGAHSTDQPIKGHNNDQVANKPRRLLVEREQRNLCLLRKNSFSCMVVGARQTGKRTIVKCFVKLLNEFKLAADEYKKEKMLSKLMECSERLNELASQQQEEADEAHDAANRRQGRTSRLNSWLPGSAVNKLLHFSPKNKRRLHSVVGIWASREENNATGQHNNLSSGGPDQQRRHTTFGHNYSTEMASPERGPSTARESSGSSRFLNVERNAETSLAESSRATINKSDTDLNRNRELRDGQRQTSFTVHQLKVPALQQMPLRKHSDITGQSSGGHFLSADEANGTQSAARRNTDATAFNWQPNEQPTPSDWSQMRSQEGLDSTSNLRTLKVDANSRDQTRRVSCKAQRKHSVVGLSRRRRRMLLSLKELNGRKCGIKFKTRRQISEACLEQLNRPVLEDVKRRASIMATNKNTLLRDEPWPESFLVVYSINDRDSFEYAKKLVGQLRATKQDVPLPVILVANKIDLERVRVVKREEGRSLARKNSCKFIELSCTVGFNLDNLLVGLRTQLILRHHIILNSILRGKSPRALYKPKEIQHGQKDAVNQGVQSKQQQQSRQELPQKGSDNILIRLYKRYVMDNSEQNYDCDNFSKL